MGGENKMTDSLQVGQIEVFTIGDIEEQFYRLGIKPVTHLKFISHTKEVKVASLTPADYTKLVNDMCIDDSNWKDAGWSNPVGSNLGVPTHTATVNGHDMLCWLEDDLNDDDEAILNGWYVDIFEYLDIGVGATTFKNASAVIKDLAKYNSMSITNFLMKYVQDGKIYLSRVFIPIDGELKEITLHGTESGRISSKEEN